MNPAVRAIYAKDLRELVRDRRALFVNLVLPVLLYPLLILFSVQVAQLSLTQHRAPPKIGVMADAAVVAALHSAATLPRSKRQQPAPVAMPAAASPVALYEVVTLTARDWQPLPLLGPAGRAPTPLQREQLGQFLRRKLAVGRGQSV